MGLEELKRDVHNRLWNAQQRWFRLREEGATKHELKLKGIRGTGDPNHFTRNLIFAGTTKRTYERTLNSFLEFAHEKFGIQRLEDIGTREFRAFMEHALSQGLAAKTLHQYRSALSKLAALTGQTASGAALSVKYGQKIRNLVKTGALHGPTRATPSPEIAQRAIHILCEWDARHFARTDEARAYHLAARLQMETSCRSISATARVTADSLRDGHRMDLIGKGGHHLGCKISPELHQVLRLYFQIHPGPLADLRGYQSAYARAVRAAGGQVTGTHGLRRLSAQTFCASQYHRARTDGMPPKEAGTFAKEETVERLGHSRDRTDQAACYLGAAA